MQALAISWNCENLLTSGSRTTNSKKCDMIDTNPESSLSESNSNSMISKTPTSEQTIAGDMLKEDLADTNAMKEMDKLTIPRGSKIE